jgi:hypothetical protein
MPGTLPFDNVIARNGVRNRNAVPERKNGRPRRTGGRDACAAVAGQAAYQPVEKGDWLRTARREPREKRRS